MMQQSFLKGLYGNFVNYLLAKARFNLNKILYLIVSSLDSLIRCR